MGIALTRSMRLFSIGRYAHFCPGCEAVHVFNVSSQDHPEGKKWTFNGDLMQPTFSPAMEVHDDTGKTVCRYFLTNGELQFLGECAHQYRNRTVPLPDFPMVRR